MDPSKLIKGVGRVAVLYHYPCPDGAFAALAAHLYHSALNIPAVFFPNTVFNPLRVKDLETDAFDAFYLLDFSGPQGFALELCSKAKRVIILDHHKTALEMLSGKIAGYPNLHHVFDMNRSGATIAFDYFTEELHSQKGFKQDTSSKAEQSLRSSLVSEQNLSRIQTLFKYIEDADLWRWALPNSRAFSSGLRDSGIEFSATINPALFEQLLALDPENLITGGGKSLAHKQLLIDAAIEKSFVVNLGSGRFGQCLAIQDDDMADLRSELGNQLALKSLALGLRPVGAVVYEVKDLKNLGLLKVSLRSTTDEDTTCISEAYGGGGHRSASSFMISKDEFEAWKK